MPTRLTTLRTFVGAAVLPLALVSPSWCRGDTPRAAGEAPATLCSPAGVLRGAARQWAAISLCAGTGAPVMSVSAPANCGYPSTKARYLCRTSGTWTATRNGVPVASGPLPGTGEYPGPGTYAFTARLHAVSAPSAVDLTGTVRATLTLTAPKPRATHRIKVDRPSVRAGSTTTLTYKVYRDSDEGDGSARLGLIAEEGTGARITTDDPRCINPLVGRHPSRTRLAYSLDCALTDLQPGHPDTVRVRLALGRACSTVVSKAGYWMPKGQALFTGGMLAGPTVACV
ncbi:hypothetical protein [Streptomyces tropicalis]|uniref:Secreted protein n=1 Tax=Streptomyces tropicalis TaxID=3034234 RepID=A0ABT6A3J6_9ACTN|nr:hypothetical protein [Streptomyces tropicalis]MDF3298956.1 hypothetical protein [Streptomyces tropicalis]